MPRQHNMEVAIVYLDLVSGGARGSKNMNKFYAVNVRVHIFKYFPCNLIKNNIYP